MLSRMNGLSSETSELAWIARTIRKRWLMIVALVAVATLAAGSYVKLRVKEYTAYAEILIQKDNADFASLNDGNSNNRKNIGPTEMESEVRLVRSFRVLQTVLGEVELPDLAQKAWFPDSYVRAAEAAVRKWMPTEIEDDVETGSHLLEAQKLRTFRKHLDIRRDPLASVISVGYKSVDPNTAAKVANLVAEAYLESRIASKRNALGETASQLRRGVDEMETSLKGIERDIERFRSDADLYSVDGVALVERRYLDLVDERTKSQLALSEAKTRLAQADAARIDDGELGSIKEVQGSRIISELRVQESQLRRRMSDLAEEFGPNHPNIKKMQAELAGIDISITVEIDRIVKQISREVWVAENRLEEITKQIHAAQRDLAGSQSSQLTLRELERKAVSSREIYEAMLDRLKRATEQEKLVVDTARLISPAVIPTLPSNFSGIFIVGAVATGSCFIGIGLASLREMRIPGFTHSADVEGEFGHEVLCMLPHTKNLTHLGLKMARNHREQLEALAYVEGVRSIVNSIVPSRQVFDETEGKILAVTSSFPGEGKTTLSLHLAGEAARNGIKTLLIEADLRKVGLRPELENILSPLQEKGLVDLLEEGSSEVFSDAIMTDPSSGADIILGFGPSKDAFALSRSRKMVTLLKSVKSFYDLIVIDCAPILAVSDTQSLCRLADETLFLVRWQSTDRGAVQSAMQELKRAEVSIGGVVMTRVDLGAHMKYGNAANKLRYQDKYGDYANSI